VNVRALSPLDLEVASAVLFDAFARVAKERGYRPPWPDDSRARKLLESYDLDGADSGDHLVVAEEGGAVVGVGAVRVRGEVASIGPIASYLDGRGIGGALLDGLIECADQAGATAIRLYADAWNPSAYALYAGRGFGVVDVVAHIERAPAPAPDLSSSRGLEVRPVEPRDHDELARFDVKLTGHARMRELGVGARLVAKRHGAIVGYLAGHFDGERVCLGPAVAVDPSDLFTLLTNALMCAGRDVPWIPATVAVRARLSTSAPAASMAALGLGFRITELGVVMSRGAPPPARPTQLYGLMPELL
jgi:GNAT superfamily N-acetyltransferase